MRWQVFSSCAKRRRVGRVGDREIESVAGAHADGADAPALRLRIGEIAGGPRFGALAAEQLIEEAAGRARGGAVLRAAIVLRQRHHHGAALLAAVGVAALQALQVDIDAVEIGAHARDLPVEVDALLRLSLQRAEQEEAACPRTRRGGFAPTMRSSSPCWLGWTPPRSGASARRAPDRRARRGRSWRAGLRGGCRAGSDRSAARRRRRAPGPGGQGCGCCAMRRQIADSGTGDEQRHNAIRARKHRCIHLRCLRAKRRG